ncbi:MAG: hypothetical protein JNK34_11625 [Tabrizicola sp.]|nr:hypothetical protein [Tabrizicola sp.]
MTKPPTPRDREVRVSDANEAGSWEGILAPGEEIVWQGAPVQALFWQFDRTKTIAALAAAAGALTFLAFTYRPAADGSGNPILVFLAWGVIAAVVYHARSFWDRRRTFYTLTNKRAFIATWHFGVQTLRAYPIATMRPLRLVDTSPGHVYFDHDTVQRRDGSGGWKEEIAEVGFLHLAEPREVHDRLLRLGAGAG